MHLNIMVCITAFLLLPFYSMFQFLHALQKAYHALYVVPHQLTFAFIV